MFSSPFPGLLHRPNTVLLSRKRVGLVLRRWLAGAWPWTQDSPTSSSYTPTKAANGIAAATLLPWKGALSRLCLWPHREMVHPPGQGHLICQLPGVIWQVWVATTNFVSPRFPTIAVHSPVAWKKKKGKTKKRPFLLIFQWRNSPSTVAQYGFPLPNTCQDFFLTDFGDTRMNVFAA